MTKTTTPLVTINQNSFEYYIHRNETNSGNIVFLNGYRTHFKSWQKIYPLVEKEANVLLYNRLGVGRSSKPNEAQDGDVVLRDMRAMCSALNFNPPYILVAHSLGGLFADLFVRRYADEVSALVLIDSPHPEEIPVMKAFKVPLPLRLLNTVLKLSDKFRGRYLHSEDEEIFNTLAMLERAGRFPDIPLRVVTGAMKMPFVPNHFFEKHQSFQKKLLELSPQAEQIVCEKSAHFPQMTEPDRILSVIREALQV